MIAVVTTDRPRPCVFRCSSGHCFQNKALFSRGDDEILDEEEAPVEETPRLKSTITSGATRKQKRQRAPTRTLFGDVKSASLPEKDSFQTERCTRLFCSPQGRGFKDSMDVDQRFSGKYDTLESGTGPGPAKCVHEEAQEDDIHEAFAEYGEIQNMHLNLDRRTGFVKVRYDEERPLYCENLTARMIYEGYAMLEYEGKKEAQAAIDSLNGTQLLDQTISVTWAFSKGPLKKSGKK
eukprot:9495032-Pyramimonas_sp.AAC.1